MKTKKTRKTQSKGVRGPAPGGADVRGRGRPPKTLDLTDERQRIAARIRAARDRAGLTVIDAARAAGVAAPTWYDWEQGRATPPLLAIPTICRALKCRRGDLMPEEE